MLAQSAESGELESTCGRGANVKLVLVTGTGQVSIQCHQSAKNMVTEVALVTTTVPSRVRCNPLSIFLLGSAGEKARGVRDYVSTVNLANVSVDLLTSNPRATFAAFEVENKGRCRDKGPSASMKWASDSLGLMNRGVQVLLERHTDGYKEIEQERTA